MSWHVHTARHTRHATNELGRSLLRYLLQPFQPFHIEHDTSCKTCHAHIVYKWVNFQVKFVITLHRMLHYIVCYITLCVTLIALCVTYITFCAAIHCVLHYTVCCVDYIVCYVHYIVGYITLCVTLHYNIMLHYICSIFHCVLHHILYVTHQCMLHCISLCVTLYCMLLYENI